MVEYPLIAVWLILNGFAAYLIYRTVQLVNSPHGRPTEPSSDATGDETDAVPHPDAPQTDPAATHPDDPPTISADVEAIQCMNCGRIQEAGFMYCENCIEPLYRR